MISKAEENEEIVHVRVCRDFILFLKRRVCRDAPMVSRLLFADDSLILMEASRSCAPTLKNIFYLYCDRSGQVLAKQNLVSTSVQIPR